jgi:hypothetical protein
MIASAVTAFIMILYIPGKEALMPGGIMLGMGVGYCLNRRFIGFNSSIPPDRTVTNRLILLARFLIGLVGFILIYTAAGKLFPQDTPNYKLYGFVRFALGGLWVSAIAPWVFIKLHFVKASFAEADDTSTEKKTEDNEQ